MLEHMIILVLVFWGSFFAFFFFFLVVKVGIPAEMTGDRKLGDPGGKM